MWLAVRRPGRVGVGDPRLAERVGRPAGLVRRGQVAVGVDDGQAARGDDGRRSVGRGAGRGLHRRDRDEAATGGEGEQDDRRDQRHQDRRGQDPPGPTRGLGEGRARIVGELRLVHVGHTIREAAPLTPLTGRCSIASRRAIVSRLKEGSSHCGDTQAKDRLSTGPDRHEAGPAGRSGTRTIRSPDRGDDRPERRQRPGRIVGRGSGQDRRRRSLRRRGGSHREADIGCHPGSARAHGGGPHATGPHHRPGADRSRLTHVDRPDRLHRNPDRGWSRPGRSNHVDAVTRRMGGPDPSGGTGRWRRSRWVGRRPSPRRTAAAP